MISFDASLKVNLYIVHMLVAAMILRPIQTMRKCLYGSYRSLQRLRNKNNLRVKSCQANYVAGGTLTEAYVRTIITSRLGENNQMTDNNYKDFWNTVPHLLNYSTTSASAQTQKAVRLSIIEYLCARSLLLTKKGYIGLGPPKAHKGDLLCVLYGCTVPVLIRKHAEYHQFVGESYIHGLMDGAAIEQFRGGTIEERDFVLK